MRNTILFVPVFIFLTTLFSCSHKKKNSVLLPELQQAEAIMYSYPDSALKILEQMPVLSASDQLQNATWCLFMTQAKYKNYIKQPSDSLIDIAYEYFMKSGNSQRKALTLYYKGALQEESNKTEEAVKYYLDANKYVSRTDDYQLGYLINMAIGNIYSFRSLIDYTMKVFLEAKHYAELSGNKVYIAGASFYLARVFSKQQKWEESICHYKKAIEIANEILDFRVLSIASNELSGIYIQLKQYEQALSYVRAALNIQKKENIATEQAFYVLGKIFCLTGKTDSACYYFKKATLSDNIYTQKAAYSFLYKLSKDKKDYVNALKYADRYQFYADSIQIASREKTLIEMQEKYNQERVINERNQLKIENDRVIRNGLLGGICLLIIIVILIYVYQRKLIRKERTIQENQELIRLHTLQIHENETLIARNESRIEELLVEIEQSQETQEQVEELQKVIVEIKRINESLHKDNEAFQSDIAHHSIVMQEKSRLVDSVKTLSDEILYLRGRERFLCDQLMRKTEILNSLKQSSKHLNATQWEHICSAIDNLYDNFTVRLAKQFPSLTENEIRICCLIKLHLPVSKMSELLSIEPTSVSKNKQRIKDRIIQGLGKPLEYNQTIDTWLWEY